MKDLVAALFFLLCTMTLCSCEKDASTPLTCCFSYISRPIPRKFLVSYYETSSECDTNGIIFLTTRGQQICANPSDAWVQKYMNNLEVTP